jgi:hypothetical protein
MQRTFQPKCHTHDAICILLAPWRRGGGHSLLDGGRGTAIALGALGVSAPYSGSQTAALFNRRYLQLPPAATTICASCSFTGRSFSNLDATSQVST